MRILTNLISALLVVAGIGVVGYSYITPSLYKLESAIQQSAVYAMATHLSVIGVGLILLGGILSIARYAHEVANALQKPAPVNAGLNAAQYEQAMKAKQLVDEGNISEAIRVLGTINHPWALNEINRLQSAK